MITDTKEWAEEQERERVEKYEKRKEEAASYYREMDDDQLLEEVARRFPGCPDDICLTCLACLDNEALVNELRKRMGGK